MSRFGFSNGFTGIDGFTGAGAFSPFAGLGTFGFAGFNQSFFSLLFSLLNFNVSVLTEGDVAPVVGLLVGVTPDFITIAGGTTPVSYIPINQITLITRVV
ncbi:MAG: DUF2642 domain-containing protein [Syntrophomonadaceae bacterium]|nr:DUF2642 domain-containing protein [Syntrophomonadaceae bacterium]